MAALSSAPGLEVIAIAANAAAMTKSPSAVAPAPHIGPHRDSSARNAATLSMPKPNRADRAARTRSTERRTMRRIRPSAIPDSRRQRTRTWRSKPGKKIVLSVDHAPDQDAEDERPQNAGKRTAGNAFFGVLGECKNLIGEGAQLLAEIGRPGRGLCLRPARASGRRLLGAQGGNLAAQRLDLGA